MFRSLFTKKKFLILSIVILIVEFSILEYLEIKKYFDIKKQTEIINRSYYSGEVNVYDGLYYIIIPSLNIKRIIKDNANQTTLDQYYVGLFKGNIDDEFGNVVLAGHNVKQVFNGLHRIEIGTKIILKSKKLETFIVDNKYETLKSDHNVLKTVTNIKQLTLITCSKKDDYRLIVTAKKVD